MIQLNNDNLIITIQTAAPLEQLLAFKKSLNHVLRFIDTSAVESQSGLMCDIQNVIELASELEFDQNQMQQIALSLQGRKSNADHINIP